MTTTMNKPKEALPTVYQESGDSPRKTPQLIMRKSNPTNAKQGNVAKADSYKEAHKRITEAENSHFFIEATAIMESIISDRILCYLHGVHDIPITTEKGTSHSFNNLIQKLEKHCKDEEIRKLCEKLHLWRDGRNKTIHSLVKSAPGKAPVAVDLFLQKAQETCSTGKRLTRAIENWTRKKIKEANS